MSNFREKSQVFIIGLLVGLIVAGSFFVLKLDDYFKELSFYKSLSRTFSSDRKSEDITVKTEDAQALKEKQYSENKTKTKKNSSDNIQKNDFVMNSDSLKGNESKDTAAKENVPVSDDIVVRKDELISTATVEVINMSPVADKMNSKDSLLQKVSGVRDDRISGQQLFNVEFWQSPLNYKGYKMSKYKIVLYGLTDVDAIKIYKLDDILYLKNTSMVYKLDYASDFRQYDRITDEAIISKFK